MGDLIDFENTKFDEEDEAILESLLKPEGSDEISSGDTGDETMEPDSDNVIPLPNKSWPPIDWEEVKSIRKAEYPRITKKVVSIIQKIFEHPGDDCYFDMQNVEGEAYPPDPVPIRPVMGDALWMIDLLDRFGGEVRWGGHRCIVKRKKKKPALFLIQPISRVSRDALSNAMGEFFEHYLESKTWVIWGKELLDELMALIITNKNDEDRIYAGWFDRKTAWVLFRRMKDLSIERVLGLE